MSEATRSATAPSRAPLWLLVLVTLSGTMAMHIFVPALPVAGIALGATSASMQQTITLYVIGLAVGQLIYGPVSDALGRRPTLLIGLAVYFSASVMALCAPSLPWLVAARLLQALGGAAGITLGRAIVRDMADPTRVTKDLALLNLLTLVGPGVAPIVGAYLADHFGWRSIYVFLVLLGTAMLISTYRLLPETNPLRRPLRVRFVARDYFRLLCHSRYMGFALGGACLSTALYPYLATVAYIVHGQMGLPIRDIGWFAASTIVGASVGTFITRRLSGRWASERFLTIGSLLGLAMAITLLVLHLLGVLSPKLLLVLTVTMTFGAGLASPAALGCVLSAVPSLTGSAAGFYGFGQMAVGALGTMVVGFGDDPMVACAVTQICLTGLSWACFRFAIVRSRRAAQAGP
jgi:DHA1 family bicyclomycin/chloramphenicol resistance-like MFS transporter